MGNSKHALRNQGVIFIVSNSFQCILMAQLSFPLTGDYVV